MTLSQLKDKVIIVKTIGLIKVTSVSNVGDLRYEFRFHVFDLVPLKSSEKGMFFEFFYPIDS